MKKPRKPPGRDVGDPSNLYVTFPSIDVWKVIETPERGLGTTREEAKRIFVKDARADIGRDT